MSIISFTLLPVYPAFAALSITFQIQTQNNQMDPKIIETPGNVTSLEQGYIYCVIALQDTKRPGLQ